MDLHAQSSEVLGWMEGMTKQFEADAAKQETFWREQKASWAEQKAKQETFWAKQEASWSEQKASWSEQKASWREQTASWREQKALWAKLEEGLRMDVLRAQGKLSSRGIFERFLELVAAEQGLKGRPNASTTIKKVGTMDVQNLGKGEF